MNPTAQQIIPVVVPVSKQGAQVYFQINLPHNTNGIYAITTAVTLIDDCEVSNGSAGFLQLQSCGRTGYFYSGRVGMYTAPANPENLGICGDNFPYPGSLRINPAFSKFVKIPFVSYKPMERVPLQIRGCRTIYGCYSDELGMVNQTDLNYQITLLLHVNLSNG